MSAARDTKADEAANTIDLNAARAARREAEDRVIVFVIGDDRYELPPELPLGVIDAFGSIAAGDTVDVSGFANGIRLLVGDETYAELTTKHGLTLEDLEVLLSQAMESYGVPFGSSAGSSPSSRSTSTPSKRTSSGTTKRTSAKSSGARKSPK